MEAAQHLICVFANLVQTYAADEAQRPLVLEVLDAAVQLHLTVLRAWAFNDGRSSGRHCRHSQVGVFVPASRAHSLLDVQIHAYDQAHSVIERSPCGQMLWKSG